MRTIELPPKSYRSTKERASALAWATLRRGGGPWVGTNVTHDITMYLGQHGYVVAKDRMINTMRTLSEQNFAYLRYDGGGHRVLEFGFLPDVDLTGHGLPKKEATKMSTSEGVTTLEKVKNGEDKLVIQNPVLPPIPALPKAPLYRLDELSKLLENWAEKDHETYATWVDTSIESLRENT